MGSIGLIIFLLFLLSAIIGLSRNRDSIYPNYMDENCKCNYKTIVYEEGFGGESGGHCPNCGRTTYDE